MGMLKTFQEEKNTYVDERVFWLLPQFEALAPYRITQRKKGVPSEKLIGWELLATIEAKNLKVTYPDDRKEEEKTYSTCLRQISALKKYLKLAAKTKLKDPKLYHPVLTIITHFGNALSFQFASYKQTQNTDYRQRVKQRTTIDNRVELDLSEFIRRAYDVLSEVAAKPDDKSIDWRQVSCAIALTTGRRMAEVQLSATFREINTYTIGFKGQLKGKTRTVEGEKLRNFEFEIPTLIPANLVCFGLEWLDKKGKRFPRNEDPERVNRRWSKVLNEKTKDWAIIPEMTYHKFRGAYFRASLVNGGVDPFDYLDFAKRVLGDEDEATIKAYQQFKIKPNSVTQI
jgi:hypothetical protein